MQSQAQREEKTVIIATGLSLFVVILALGGVVGWTLNAVVDPGIA